MTTTKSLLERALPFLRDEAAKYEDDGSNEPLELAREIDAILAESQAGEAVAWDEGSPCMEPRPVGMVYPPKPAPRASGYLDGSDVEWNAYDTSQMEAYARIAYADGYAAAKATPTDPKAGAWPDDVRERIRVAIRGSRDLADAVDNVMAALTAAAPQAPVGGEWVLVPEDELVALVAGPYKWHHKMDDAAMREAKAFDRCRELTIQNIRTWCAARRAMLAAAPPALTQPVGKEYWATQYPGKMPRLFGQRWIAELNWYPHGRDGHALVRLVEAERIESHPEPSVEVPA